jgi:hypothetical protein
MSTRVGITRGLLTVLALSLVLPSRAQQPQADPEIAKLREEVATRQRELRDAEDRLNQALQKRKPEANPLPPLLNGERAPFELDTPARTRPLVAPSRVLPGPMPQEARMSADPKEDRLADVERKLDRLLEAMEGMRRDIEELKRGRGQ